MELEGESGDETDEPIEASAFGPPIGELFGRPPRYWTRNAPRMKAWTRQKYV